MIKYSKLLVIVGIFWAFGCQNAIAEDHFWQQTNGPYGGLVQTLSIDSNGFVYAGGGLGGVFRSSNKGTVWEQISLGTTHLGISSIITDSDGHVYFSTRGDGIYRAGETFNSWEKINEGLTSLKVHSLGILPGGSLFVTTKDGLYKSSNHGDKWTNVSAINARSINAFRIHEDGLFIVSDSALLSYSSDGGENWHKIKEFENMSITSIAVGSDSNLYVGTSFGEVFHSKGYQGTWDLLTSFETKRSIKLLEIDPKGNLYVSWDGPWASGILGGFYSSSDNGINWRQFNTLDPSSILLTDDEIYIGTGEGIYHSEDNGTSWTRKNSGFISERVNDIVINQDDVLFAGSYGGVFRSDDNGNNWTEINNGLTDHGILDMAVSRTGDLFVGTYLSSIFRSTDNGNTWVNKSNGLPVRNNWIMSIEINSRNEIFAATTGHGVFRSTDNGDSWTPVNDGLADSTPYWTMAIASDDVIYVGSWRGAVFRSANNGLSWQKIETKNEIIDYFSSLAVDSKGRLYVGAANTGVYRYSERDHLWIQVNNGLEVPNIRSLTVDSKDIIFAGTTGSLDYSKYTGETVYKSVDMGANWILINSGLHHARIKALAINSKGFIFAGTWGGGVFRSVQPVSSQETADN